MGKRTTTASKYLAARAKGQRVNVILRDAAWHPEHGAGVVTFPDGSVIWMHVGTGAVAEASSVAEAVRLRLESVGR